MPLHYFLAYKPYGYLTQFSGEPGDLTLKDLDFAFPKQVYPVGRLDKDSEGLLLLTDDKRINHALLNPRFAHQRSYWVQVEGIPSEAALAQLRQGLQLKTHRSLPAQATLIPEPPVPPREPPIRFRKTIPTQWLSLTLGEGKNRQVRRMTAAIGYPTLRLIRYQIEHLSLQGLQPKAVRSLTDAELNLLLKKLGLKTKI